MRKEHITDIVYSHLKKKVIPLSAPLKKGKKVFLSDWEIKKLYNKEKKEIILPENTIISPLSLDWIEFNNIKIIKR